MRIAPSYLMNSVTPTKRNAMWAMGGYLAYLPAQWLLLIILTRLGDPETVGLFALSLAIGAPLMMFSNLRLRFVLASDMGGQFAFNHYLSLRIITAALAFIAILIIGCFVGKTVFAVGVIATIGFAKAVEDISDIFHGIQQRHEQMRRVAVSLVLKAVGSVLAFGSTYYLTGNLLLSCISLSGAWILVLIGYDIPKSRALRVLPGTARPHASSHKEPGDERPPTTGGGPTLMRLAKLSLPLGCVALLSSLLVNLPRYFIEAHLGAGLLGAYAAMAYLIIAGTTLVNGLGQALLPRLATAFTDHNMRLFRSYCMRLLAVVAGLGIAGILAAMWAGEQLLEAIYGSFYMAHNRVLVLLCVAGTFNCLSLILWHAITASRHFMIQAPAFLLNLLAVGILCYVLIPRYGLPGVGYALILANLLGLGIAGTIFLSVVRTGNKQNQPA